MATAGAMAAVTWLGWNMHWTLGLAVYVGLLAVLRVFTPAEQKVLRGVLPARFKQG